MRKMRAAELFTFIVVATIVIQRAIVFVDAAPPTTLTGMAPASVNVNQNFNVTGRLTSNGSPVAITRHSRTPPTTPPGIVTTKQANSYASYTFTFNETTAGTVYYRTTYASDTTTRTPRATS